VTLKRVTASSCTGSDVAGCFKGAVDQKTGQRADVLEIADKAFEEDKQIEDPTVARVKETDLAGKLITMLPSQRTVLHEVGHGAESAELRPAQAATFRADVAATEKQSALKKAIAKYNQTSTSVPPITWSNRDEHVYVNRLEAAGKSLAGVVGPINALDKLAAVKLTHAAFKKGADDTRTLVTAAEKAIKARDNARGTLKPGSSVVQSDVEAGQDANLAAAKEMLKALEVRRDAQEELETKTAAEAAASAEITLGGSKQKISRRLGQLVALINLKGIDIKKSQLRSYVKDKWPGDPGEVFADLYQMSVSEPEGLKAFDPDVADFFKDPIGPKAKWKPKADAWIKSH
jgi:hypothetical protein